MTRVRVISDSGMARFRGAFASRDDLRSFQRALDGVRWMQDKRARLAPLDKVPAILDRLREAGFDVVMDEDMREIVRRTTAQEWIDKQAVRERIERIDGEIKAVTGETLFPFQKTGASWLSTRTGAVLADEMGVGKALAVDENVVLEEGFRRIGDLKVGDEVIGSDGEPTKVLGVYPQGEREVFRVLFTGGRSVRCDLQHLWTVFSSEEIEHCVEHDQISLLNFVGAEPKTLEEMASIGLFRKDGRPRWYVPVLFADRLVDHDVALFAATYELDDGEGDDCSYSRAFAGMVGLEYVGKQDCVCIKVEAEDELFAVNDFILTHNTRQIITALPTAAPVLVVCNSGAKGVWAGEIAKCRPQLRYHVLRGRGTFRWPKADEVIIMNYDILPSGQALHDASGRGGKRRCHGELPAEPCKGCKEQLVVGRPPARGGQLAVTSIATVLGHDAACDKRKNFKVPEPCPGCHPFLAQVLPGTVVVGDEAHFIKNGDAARTQAFRAMACAARDKGGRSWLATGTPMENEPRELWSIFLAAGVAEEAFGDFKNFAKLFKGSCSLWGYTWGLPDEEVPEIVERARRVMLRRLRKDVLPELPTKMYQPILVEVDDKNALAGCDAYLSKMGGIDRVMELVEKEELNFSTMASIRAALASAKIPAMLEIVREYEEMNEPLLVFSAHRAPIDLLGRMRGWAVITGDEDDVKKRAAAEKFQRGELKGLGLTIRAGGTAITLTRAARMLFVDRDWKPTANAQAEDRCVRIGQTRGVVVMYLTADHALDRRLSEVLLKKQRLITASVDAASTIDDAVEKIDKDFEREVAALQKEILAEGSNAPRTLSEDIKVRVIFDRLVAALWRTRAEERLAHNLMEEALSIGLTSKQWELATLILERYGDMR